MKASKRLFAIAALIAPVLLAACSDMPTEPQLQPAFNRNLEVSRAQLDAQIAPDAPTATKVTRTVGKGGGILSANGATLVIPAGALTRNTAITMTVTTSAEPKITLEPHGLVLQRPAQLSYSPMGNGGVFSVGMDGLLESTPALGVWELLEYTLTSKGLILVGG